MLTSVPCYLFTRIPSFTCETFVWYFSSLQCAGAAGKPDNSLNSGIISAADMKFAAATGGFVFVAKVTDDEMHLKFVDYTGDVLYSTTRAQVRHANVTATHREYTGSTSDQSNTHQDNTDVADSSHANTETEEDLTEQNSRASGESPTGDAVGTDS